MQLIELSRPQDGTPSFHVLLGKNVCFEFRLSNKSWYGPYYGVKSIKNYSGEWTVQILGTFDKEFDPRG